MIRCRGITQKVGPGLRLTALHLIGFKSFADKTELRFGPGVTAIVGPNGSGKSNVVDAVRWVLGEQNTRSLRSDRVTQLIFAGTERRNPLGLAQATLVLDNTEQSAPIEYSELNIVRRVYRSGDSEFLINGTPCRLRDIQQLLLGTGLGRGGMAVVGQGEIDAILSARPQDRRQLLEETAGTSRYRAQQRTAEQRLERARQDLSRVRDLIVELTSRVEVLDKQAAAARRYKEITGALQRQRAARAARDWARARGRLEDAAAGVAKERERLAELEQAAAASRREVESARRDLEAVRRRLEEGRDRLQQLEASRSDLAHRLQLLQLQWQSAEERRSRAAHDREVQRAAEAQALEQLRTLESELQREREAVENLRSETRRAAEALRAFEERHRGDAIRGARLRDELMEVLQTAARLRNELQRLEEQAKSSARDEEQDRELRRTLQDELQGIRAELEEAEREARQGAAALQHAEEEDRRLGGELQQAREKLSEARRQAADLRSRLQETEATGRALERLEETYAGYRPAVKAVLGARPAPPGLLGTVGQLLEVPERFELPVQAALGAATQFIVAEREEAVSEAIELLRRQRAGRATFLSLDAIRSRPWPREGDKLLQEPGVLGRAADLVLFDDVLRPVVIYLLGRVVVVEELRRAQVLARGASSALRLVTMQGDLLTPGGPVTGGFQGTQSVDGTLSRRRELRKLRAKREQLTRRLKEATGEAEEAEARVRELEEAIEGRRNAHTARVIEQARQHQRALLARGELERLEKSLDELDARDGTRVRTREEAALRGEELQHALQTALARENALRAELDEIGEAAQRTEAERQALAESAAAAREAFAAREQSLKALQHRRADAMRSREKAEADGNAIAQAERRARVEGERLRKEIEELESRLPDAESKIEEQRRRLTETAAEQTARQEKLAQQENLEREHAAAAAEAKERVWSKEAAFARWESALEGATQRLKELGVTQEDAEAGLAEEASGTDVGRLEAELQRLGSVHLGAEEELAEVQERLHFLEEQQRDLEQAGTSLEEVIERLDKVSEEQFAETLAKVAGQFDVIFRRLFGGGQGHLRMAEDGDGVDVHVQMPGKRMQNLLALSGGERALTAIALLFAILQVRPSPFYLLDEIDSALDEANLERFQQMLREAARDAQFIVITHRATTMEVADTLYGVTASEPGVSTVISLDLQTAMASIA